MKHRIRASKKIPNASLVRFPSDTGPFTQAAFQKKVRLMENRLRALEPFSVFSFTRFVENLPGFSRLMPLLVQSTVDVCHVLTRWQTPVVPRSTYDIFDVCEQHGVISAEILQPLLRELVLIESGLELEDTDEVIRIHREIPETVRAFREFLDRCEEYCR